MRNFVGQKPQVSEGSTQAKKPVDDLEESEA
jgi:hypothetical protein